MTDSVDAVVVGAGVIGLAIARRLATAGHETIVIESAEAVGSETSSRNSEVIHAGIYYPAGSLKAKLCVEGKKQLYAFAASHGIDHQPVGKLIVASSDEQISVLEDLKKKGQTNGVDDLEMISAKAAISLEPNLNCVAALKSPSTGIIDSHGLMLALQGDAEVSGAVVSFLSRLNSVVASECSFHLEVTNHVGAVFHLNCRILINAAGLSAQEVAHSIAGLDPALIPKRYLSKGSYFSYRGRAPFNSLIYPVPGTASLGLHYTRDLAGQARFGPDHEDIDKVDYNVEGKRAASFYDAIRRYFPGLPDDSLIPAYAGVRPKVQKPGEPMQDFVIQNHESHGLPGLINLFGIESPGLTSSLALANYVFSSLP